MSYSLQSHGPHQAPLSMEFSRQEFWSGLSFPSPGDLPNPGIEPGSPALLGYPLQYSWASLVPQLVENPPAVWFDPWVGKLLWRWEWLSTAVIWTEEFHGLYSPWGHKEWDIIEQLSLSFLHCRQTLYHLSPGKPNVSWWRWLKVMTNWTFWNSLNHGIKRLIYSVIRS